MRSFAIGDIHGCSTALTTLLKSLPIASDDKIIFLGDYIDRGPRSREVLETLLEFSSRNSAIFLRGNHEVMMLDAREDPLKSSLWQSYGGLETLFSYGLNYQEEWVAGIPALHWEFLERTVRFFETEKHIFVHACLDADLDLPNQPDWLLYWEFLDRLKPHKSGKQIICGHSPQRDGKPRDLGFAVCIDTGPAKGGWLTCLEPGTGEFWQSNESGETRCGKL